MNKYIEEKDIDELKIRNTLGDLSYGDENFAVFKCPKCKEIYLIDYEVDTIFSIPDNVLVMSNRNSFVCKNCGYDFRGGIIIGDKANECFKVSLAERLC